MPKGLYIRTPEIKKKNSVASKELWQRQPHPKGMLGKKHSEELKRNFSLLEKGSNNPNWKGGLIEKKCEQCGKTFKHKIAENGKRFCSQVCFGRFLSPTMIGEKNRNWKGDLAKEPETERIRKSIQYQLWRHSVFSRDGWTCQECGQWGGKLQAHHIKGFAKHPELRFAIDNGITLCVKCHGKTKNYGGGSKNGK